MHWLLSKLFHEGLNKNTVIIVLSDHGIRFGKLRNTKSGFYEERLPFLRVYIPDQMGPGWNPSRLRKVLKDNEHRLTSHFDLHATLMHLANGTSQLSG